MKSVLLKIIYATLVALLINGAIIQKGMASQKIKPSADHREATEQTNGVVSEWYSHTLQTTSPWNTFLGGDGDDKGYGLTRDGSGNGFVAGYSVAPWGNPVRAYSAGSDGFVAMLDSSGNLVWNTFLGGSSEDSIHGIALDDLGNIYVIGFSTANWGDPLQEHRGVTDDFVAKLDSSGNLLWNTFLGLERNYLGAGIVVDSSGNIYVNSSNKLVPDGPNFASVTKLDSSGNLAWNTLLGDGENVFGHGIALDENLNVFVTGYSHSTWGNPVIDYTGAIDAFVAKLDNSSGELLWNTFIGGGEGRDVGYGIALDVNNNIYITGHSTATWGNPVRAYTGDQDGLVVKLDLSGNLIWNTFLGGVGTDFNGYEIELDDEENILVAGASNAPWGIPIQSYNGDNDAVLVKLNSSGSLLKSTFLGGPGIDKSYGIALGENGDVFVAGYSNATWGVPVGQYTGNNDVFIASINFAGIPESLIVTKTDDTDDGACDSDCSLREAIATASPAALITFDSALSGQTIVLLSTLSITKNLIIDGFDLDQNVRVSGDANNDNNGDVLAFSITANKSVELNGIDIDYGYSSENGGGISNSGFLTLKNCNMNANRASHGGGIYNSSNAILYVSNCTFSNNEATNSGGGIANFGTLEITESTFSGNMASGTGGRGNAIYAEGISKVLGSTFFNNSEGTGTIYHTSTQESTSLTLENDSFENNDTAIYNYDGKAAINNNTIYANERGIYVHSDVVEISNSIVSHNFFNNNPTDCYKGTAGTIGKDNFNFFSSDNNCGVSVSGYGISINSLANNGGPTKTMALNPNSPAINAGQDETCIKTDQRGIGRPQGSHCDIGSYEYGEELPPMVVAITGVGPSLTSSQIVEFKVRFSETVTGVNTSDFSFTKTGSINGYSIKSISPDTGPADSYIILVDTGKYNGTLRLNVVDNDSIKDAVNDPLGGPGNGNGSFSSGQVYTVLKKYTLTLKSIAAQDGWILESGEATKKGGQVNNSQSVFYLGDNSQKKQYRSILSFNTEVLPQKAVITKITLKLRKQAIVGGGNPIIAFQGLIFDFRKGYFGSAAGLQASDFQANLNNSYGPFKPNLTGSWYVINLTSAITSINGLDTNGGVTQIRLRFKLDDNNNKVANNLKLFSGNAPIVSRPQLIIEYYVP